MTVEAIAAVGTEAPQAITLADLVMPDEAPQDVSSVAFDAVMQSLESLNTHMQANAEAASQLALGQADNLHQIMINGEQTRLEFELALSVRNKVLEAYQELMRMQV
jgi:flagellar hook-basal body complex protein FliE